MPQSRQRRPRHRFWSSAWHRFWTAAWHHFAPEFLFALFVAAVITLLNDETDVLEAVNVYAFWAVGNADAHENRRPLLAIPAGPTEATKAAGATVVLIDESAYAAEYDQMSPLSRCPLYRDLGRIYASRPRLVVIDLDISPALWLDNWAGRECRPGGRPGSAQASIPSGCQSPDQVTPGCQAQCQGLLYQLIKASGVNTVLMLPFGVPDLEHVQPDARLASWMSCMRQSPHVSFGDPTLEPRFGLVLDGATVKDSMAALACKADTPENRNCEEKRHGAEHTINPRVFLDGTVNSVTSSQFAQQRGVSGQVRGSAVFFGGSWDDTDHYMTPAGMVNGVEVHAAAFTSIGNHSLENKWLAFVVDLTLGLAFGFITGWLWGQYFDCRLSEGVRQQLGWFYILLLIIGFIFIIAIAFRLSYELLARWQIWASPVPVAIGRFIEGFVTGSVAQAVEAALKGRHQGIAGPRGLYGRMRRSAAKIVELWKKVEDPGPESEVGERRLPVKPTWVSAHKNQLALALGKWKYRGAAIVLVLGPLLWCVVVIACLVSLFEVEDFE